ncbi:hypothetical protein [Bradyrhizobium sp. 191]|uniref:hypothetical protein n=1 Tax=Bradyrhizobium sp. 191 TaxID=2782659 RepID=UPI001FFFB2CB|nr:hypothetical protein [Bradyrhizobium sp. 191]UPJ62423.1 hypothetical protein IVB23_20380 [Bradyrhizobium sp. 191]
MCKITLFTAMLLASASVQAGGSRGLSLASAGEQSPAPQTTTSSTTSVTTRVSEAAPATEAPKYTDRPPAVSLSAPAAATAATVTTHATSAPVTTTKPATKSAARADKPKHKRSWTERRIISELHRHGIYW